MQIDKNPKLSFSGYDKRKEELELQIREFESKKAFKYRTTELDEGR
jgi:hypothetical protein